MSSAVIIPTYNRQDSLVRTLRSIGRQSLLAEHYEVIIVDDGSNDRTRNVAEIEFPFRLRYVYRANSGDAEARNTGAGSNDAELIDAALAALLQHYRRAELDEAYEAAYVERPIGEPDDWGDLGSFRDAAAAT